MVIAVAALIALGSCGQSHAATRSPTPGVTRVATETPTITATPTATLTITPMPPRCDRECVMPTATPVPPTQTPTPQPTATPVKPAITPVATIQVSGGSLYSLGSVLQAAGWPPSLWSWAEYIIGRESGGDPMAQNPSGASGLFQIMPQTWAGMGCVGNPFDAFENAVCAWRLYGVAGVSPWAIH